MKRFLYNVIAYFSICACIFAIYACVGHYAAPRVYGVSSKDQIDISFNNAKVKRHNVVFMGNSRVYHGINPDIMSSDAYNFAHDNDSFNQSYYKLDYLIRRNNAPDTIFLGIDYFEFGIFSSTKNYCYDKYFSNDYWKDYSSNWATEQISNIQRIFFNNQTLTIRSLLKSCFFTRFPDSTSYIKPNGQYIMFGSKGSPNDKVSRTSKILDIQKYYFEKILQTCKDNDIKCIIFMMPVRDGEIQSYNDRFLFSFEIMIKNFTKQYDVSYIDLSRQKEFLDYSLYDDITHFNATGADKFTKFLEESISLR